MRRSIALVVSSAALFFGSYACGDDATVECAAGAVQSCSCPDGAASTQLCRADGSGFHACACSVADGDAGAGAGGGAGGSGAGGGVAGGSPSFAPGDVVWALSAGDLFNQEGHDVEIDAAGNLWVTGHLDGDTDLGGGELKVQGFSDVFLGQFAPGGSHLASARFGDFDESQAVALALHDGQAVVTGTFFGSFDFGAGSELSHGHNDIFVAKLAPDGAAGWSRGLGGLYFDFAEDVAVDPAGDVYVAGYFMSDVDFGGGVVAVEDALDGYLLKLGADGSFRWLLPFAGADDQQCFAVAADASGVWVGGRFENEIDAAGSTLNSAGGFDGFVARVTSDGDVALMLAIGDGDAQSVRALANAPLGGVVIAAELSGTATIGNRSAQSGGFVDMLIAAIDADGEARFMRALGGKSNDWVADVAVAPNGAVAVAGRFEDAFEVGDISLLSEGGADAVVLKLNAAGDLRWARSYGDNEDDGARGVAIDKSGFVAMTGYFTRDVEFGGTHVSAGLRDLLVARLAP